MPAALIFREDHVRLKEFPLPHAFSLFRAGNMAERFGNPAEVRRRNAEFLNALGLSRDRCVGMVAEHGSRVLKIERGQLGSFLRCDCLVTFIPGTALTLAPADCFPVLLTNYNKSFAALIHAGWQGLDKGVVGECVRFLKRKKIQPFEILVAVGPGIRECCFNNQGLHSKKEWESFVSGDSGGRVDLLAKLKQDFVDSRVPEGNIQDLDLKYCTCCAEKDGPGSGHLWYSHWRKKDEGRLLAVVALG